MQTVRTGGLQTGLMMLYLQNKLEGLTLSMKDLYSSTTVVQFNSVKVSLQQVARVVFHNRILLASQRLNVAVQL